MKIDLLYGQDGISVTLPGSAKPTIIAKRDMPVLSDPRAAVASALDAPVQAPRLESVPRDGQSACILICDITRPVPNGLFLRPLIEKLLGSGMKASDITVLVATGLHRPNEGAELSELVGDPWVERTVEVVNHFARDDAMHWLVGTTTRGTVVRLDRRFLDADVRIATGLVEPHFMAGYSGGRKVIAPGIAHAQTITTFHNHRFMSHPEARNCNLAGNPLHEEQLAIVEMLDGVIYALNTVIDDERRLAFVNFGEIRASHADAVDFVGEYAEIEVPRRFHTVVTSAAGYPLDQTYYQTVKGMVGAMDILAPGGDLFIAAQCQEGLGSPEYRESQEKLIALGRNGFLDEISRKRHAAIDEWQTQMQTKPTEFGTIGLYAGGLSEADHALTGVSRITELDAAIADSLDRHGTGELAVIPEGPYVIPRASTDR